MDSENHYAQYVIQTVKSMLTEGRNSFLQMKDMPDETMKKVVEHLTQSAMSDFPFRKSYKNIF